MSGTGLEQQLRCSVTVDGVTNVYAFDDGDQTNGYQKKYYTVEADNGADTPTEKTGRSVEEFSYYDERFSSDGTPDTTANNAFANRGADNKNLNGNTLFTVNKYDLNHKAETAKTVTFKLWLESRERGGTADTAGIDLASLNLNIISGWAKTRRIYIKDETVDEIDNGSSTGAHWLTHQNTPTLHWALASNVSTHWEKDGDVSSYIQYFDVPAVYNNVAVYMSRCDNGWNNGNSTKNGITCWDQYSTTFPNTFHSETYTVYTKAFGTWDTVARQVEFINSCHFTIDNNTQFAQPYAYMWDSSTDTGAPERVVQNASWPGVSMTKLNKKKSNLDVYAFYYNSILDRIIFNDDYNPSSAAYQTHDLNLDQAKTNPQFYVGKVFDMATLKWYNNFNSLPTYSDYSVRGEFFTSDDQNRWTVSRMVVNPNNSNELYCRVYVRYQSSGSTYYRFKIMKNDQSEWWGYGHDNTDHEYWYIDGEMSGNSKPTLEQNNSNNLRLHATNTASYTDASNNQHPGIYGIYFNTSSHELWVQKESP